MSDITQNIKTIGNSLFADPLTFKKAILLCFYAIGLQYAASFIAYMLNISIGLVPQIIFLAAVLFIAWGMGKDELRRILVMRHTRFKIFVLTRNIKKYILNNKEKV